jgi:hypothetical protein
MLSDTPCDLRHKCGGERSVDDGRGPLYCGVHGLQDVGLILSIEEIGLHPALQHYKGELDLIAARDHDDYHAAPR